MKIRLNLLQVYLLKLILLFILLPAPHVFAESPVNNQRQNGLRIFSVHDRNQDGYLDKSEYQQLVEQKEKQRQQTGRPMRRFFPALQFEQIDADGDGRLNEDELIKALNRRLEEHRHYRYKGGQ